MDTRNLLALAALASASLLVRGAPALASPIADARETTQLGASLVADANLARQALVSGKTVTANDDINAALAVRDKLAQSAHANGTSMIVPLYTELDDTTVLSLAVKKRSDAAAHAMTASTVAPALTPRSNLSQVTYLAIDLDKAKVRLDAAQLAMRNHNDQAATDSLSRIGSDLLETTVSADEPLLTARQDLILAQNALKADHYSTASADLQQASSSLKNYANAGHGADLQRMAADIDSSTPVDSNGGSGLSTKIDGWWSSMTNWFSQHA